MPPVCHIGAVFLRALTGILGIIASSLQMVKRKAMTGSREKAVLGITSFP
jgi:hypothetical protein